MASPTALNYANLSGIFKSEFAGAIIFAVVYAPLFFYNVVRSMRHRTYVLVVLSFFCLIRVVAFTMRGVLAGSEVAGQNLDLLVAQQIIYSVGFFGLLYSAYTLVLDRELIIMSLGGREVRPGIIRLVSRIMRSRHLIRLVLLAAVGLGIAGGVESSESSQHAQDLATSLRRASVYIFLVLACMLVLVIARLAFEEELGGEEQEDSRIGNKYRLILLLAISLLCVSREAFFAATSENPKQQNNAHLWYPLSALTELVAVLLFAAPGLVPSRAEIIKDHELVPQDDDKYGREKVPTLQTLRRSETRAA